MVTGGEPLLRRDLTLEVVERLDAAGVGTTLNTNGWFVDDAVADRLGRCRGLSAFVSLDGATSARPRREPRRARGLGARRRRDGPAAGARRPVRIVHVVTPDTEPETEALIELGWRLGVNSVQMTPVVPTGAAARGGEWQVDAPRLRRIAERAAGSAPAMPVLLRTGSLTDGMAPTRRTPLGLLVRPTGAVRIESVNPFAFGNARRDGLAACWSRIVEGFDCARADGVGPQAGRDGRLRQAGRRPVPGRRRARRRVTTTEAARAAALAAPLPAKSKAREPGPYASVEGAVAHARELGLARGYRRGAVRVSGEHVRIPATGAISGLNATALAVLEACSPGTAGDAVEALAAAYPAEPRERIEATC